ncbi:hypothetical protein EMMF5_000784 [Cystobasidiomycetes sp. EMM_F5]
MTTPVAHGEEAYAAAPVEHAVPVQDTHPISQGMGYNEAKHLHKVLEKEGKSEDKNIAGQVKEISKAEKAESKAVKADNKAAKAHNKAVEHEHSLAKDLERIQAKHDQAVREAQKTANEINVKQNHHVQITQSLQNAKAHLNELTHVREEHHAERDSKLKELEAIIEDHKKSK